MPDPAHEEAKTLLQRLIACDTSNPPGREAQAAAMLEAYLEPFGIECERVAKDPERPNLLARLRGRGDGPSLAFLGHLDVVQARRQDWTVEPITAGAMTENEDIPALGRKLVRLVGAAYSEAASTVRFKVEPDSDGRERRYMTETQLMITETLRFGLPIDYH